MNNKGQAALVDSIMFLTIVSIICTMLFYFAINYGVNVESQISSFYSKDFAQDILKVITYINVSRSGDPILFETLEEERFEPDYLLALIKEDYADTFGDSPSLKDSTKRAIATTVTSVVAPFEHAIDYAFYMINESSTERGHLFLFLATRECVDDEVPCPEVERNYYYCIPYNSNILEDEVFPNLNKVDSSTGKVVLFSEEGRGSSPTSLHFLIGFSGWISEDVPVLYRDNVLGEGSAFNCREFDDDFYLIEE